jgi:hypothetical protein
MDVGFAHDTTGEELRSSEGGGSCRRRGSSLIGGDVVDDTAFQTKRCQPFLYDSSGTLERWNAGTQSECFGAIGQRKMTNPLFLPLSGCWHIVYVLRARRDLSRSKCGHHLGWHRTVNEDTI